MTLYVTGKKCATALLPNPEGSLRGYFPSRFF
jgi:hypothetical protein